VARRPRPGHKHRRAARRSRADSDDEDDDASGSDGFGGGLSPSGLGFGSSGASAFSPFAGGNGSGSGSGSALVAPIEPPNWHAHLPAQHALAQAQAHAESPRRPRVSALGSLVVHGSKSLATLADLDLRPGFAFLAAAEDRGAGSLQAALRSARLQLGLDAAVSPMRAR